MAKYTSRYAELGFYVDGELRKFIGGEFRTDDAKMIAVLDALADADRVDEPEEPAAPKAQAPRKSSAK
ncbi:hypothetical protein [Paenibacillus naphthalenovorans]|uniref:hypothetical protein n=1 Tax=Paenibacillus naphthalenovorans TaxID=162209 RepID=UPI003D2D9D5A